MADNETMKPKTPKRLTKDEMRARIKASLAASEENTSSPAPNEKPQDNIASKQTDSDRIREEKIRQIRQKRQEANSQESQNLSYEQNTGVEQKKQQNHKVEKNDPKQENPTPATASTPKEKPVGTERKPAPTPTEKKPQSPHKAEQESQPKKREYVPVESTRQSSHYEPPKTPVRNDYSSRSSHTAVSTRPFWIAPLIILAAIIVILLVVFFVGRSSYKDKFLANTYINNINVGGMTMEEAEDEVLTTAKEMGLKFITKDGETISFKDSSFGCVTTLTDGALDKAYSENHNGWFKKLFQETDYTVTFNQTYSESDLVSLIAAYDWGNTPPTDATIVEAEDGTFSIQPEDDGNMIDTTKLADYTVAQMAEGNNVIYMEEANCYKTASVHAEDLTDLLELYNSIGNLEITYDLTDREECMDPVGTVVLDSETILSWVNIDENGDIQVDEEAATDWVQTNLADEYDTYVTGYTRTFKSTMDGTIQMPLGTDGAGIYGWKTNVTDTTAELIDHIKAGNSVTLEPVWRQEGFRLNSNSGVVYTGDTYVEVDKCHQHLWYYVNGELYMDCDIVSGLESDPERATPIGVGFIRTREKDVTLGTMDVQGYECPVSYWMPFTYLGIGLHDLNRSAYGGEIYLTNGSHGCINMPLESAQKLFEKVTVGTPVLVIP